MFLLVWGSRCFFANSKLHVSFTSPYSISGVQLEWPSGSRLPLLPCSSPWLQSLARWPALGRVLVIFHTSSIKELCWLLCPWEPAMQQKFFVDSFQTFSWLNPVSGLCRQFFQPHALFCALIYIVNCETHIDSFSLSKLCPITWFYHRWKSTQSVQTFQSRSREVGGTCAKL